MADPTDENSDSDHEQQEEDVQEEDASTEDNNPSEAPKESSHEESDGDMETGEAHTSNDEGCTAYICVVLTITSSSITTGRGFLKRTICLFCPRHSLLLS